MSAIVGCLPLNSKPHVDIALAMADKKNGLFTVILKIHEKAITDVLFMDVVTGKLLNG